MLDIEPDAAEPRFDLARNLAELQAWAKREIEIARCSGGNR